jgi:hypothetical protein
MDYRALYASATAELQTVQAEKVELEREIGARDQQIAALTQTINAIAPLIGEPTISLPATDAPETATAGMTDCIRAILAKEKHPLSAAQVRDRLEQLGFVLSGYSNPLATIHTVLRRLTDAGEVEADYEMAESGPKRFSVKAGTGYKIEKVAGKSFEIGKMKGFIGVGRLKRNRDSAAAPSQG